MHAMAVSESLASSTPRATIAPFHDLDELLLGPTDLEAMPFEFGCDFASAFEDKHLDVDTPGPSLGLSHVVASPPAPRVREAKSRSHRRKSDGLASSSVARMASVFTRVSPPMVLDNDNDDLSSLDPRALSSADHGSTQIGRWTKKEHELFLEGLRLYGKSWKKISSLVVTRTLVQIRTHAQKYLQKQNKSAIKAAAAAAAAASGATAVTTTGASSKSRKAPLSHLLDEDALPAAWEQNSHHGHSRGHRHSQSQSHSPASLFRPIAFPDYAASSSSSPSSSAPPSHSISSSSSSSSIQLCKELASHSNHSSSVCTMSKLDQLLQDEPHTAQDDYYSSPTGSDDDLVQWLQHRHLPTLVSSPAPKRRRTDAMRSSSTSSPWAIVNPMEAMTASYPSFYTSQNQSSSSSSSSGSHTLNGDFLPPLSAYATNSHSDSEFTFGHSWL